MTDCEKCGGEMVPTGDIAIVTRLNPDCEIWIYGVHGEPNIYHKAVRKESGLETGLTVVDAALVCGLSVTIRDNGYEMGSGT